MPHNNFKISPKSVGIVAALAVPMLLIPTSGQARSDRHDWNFLNQPIKVKQGYDRGADSEKYSNDRFRRFFDGSAPRKTKTLRKARNKRLNRMRNRGKNSSRRHGYTSDYYDDEYGVSCVSPRKIHQRLHAQGWRNFHNLRIRSNALMFKARQIHQGRQGRELTYNLRIDRCSGAIVKTKLQRQDMWFIRWMRRISNLY